MITRVLLYQSRFDRTRLSLGAAMVVVTPRWTKARSRPNRAMRGVEEQAH